MSRPTYQIIGPYGAAAEGPIATAMNEKPKAVFSHPLTIADWGPAEIFGADQGAGIADLNARDSSPAEGAAGRSSGDGRPVACCAIA